MDTVTYPDPATVQMVHDYLIAVRVQIRSEPVLAQKFAVQYTPTVVTLDEDGIERHRSVGFLPPQEFVPSILLGIGKAYYEKRRFNKAGAALGRLLSMYPESRWVMEASNLKRAADKLAH
jgi:thioredoxin-related protein